MCRFIVIYPHLRLIILLESKDYDNAKVFSIIFTLGITSFLLPWGLHQNYVTPYNFMPQISKTLHVFKLFFILIYILLNPFFLLTNVSSILSKLLFLLMQCILNLNNIFLSKILFSKPTSTASWYLIFKILIYTVS